MYDRSRLSIGDEAVLDQWIAIAEQSAASEQPPAYVEPKAETPAIEPVEVLETVDTYTYEFTYDEETPLPLLDGFISKRFKRYPYAIPEHMAIGDTIPDSRSPYVVWITAMTFANGEITVWYFYSIDGGLREYRKAAYSAAALNPEDTQTLRDMWVRSRVPIVPPKVSDEDRNSF
jgi:hypothetical protein